MRRDVADRMEVVVGDITRLEVDAIANAANESLVGGGGVDGAIHRAAGPELYEECRKIGTCPEGQARITGGHRLAAKHIIHTVGPIYEGGGFGEAETLASCYRETLSLAEAHAVETIAFPCIATGVYGYPGAEACAVAIEQVTAWLDAHELPRRVIFCCFSEGDAVLYRDRLGAPSA